jgi:uncharacterized membrane protein YgdD (TMEM256/DUF423 family)
MAVGLAVAIANDVLDAIARNDALTTLPAAAVWIKLHTGDPGAAGATAPAGNTTRKQATFGSGAAAGLISNTAAITWTSGEVTTSEDYSHYSAWNASTAGTFLFSGVITANAVTAGDQFTIPIGDLDLSFTIAA